MDFSFITVRKLQVSTCILPPLLLPPPAQYGTPSLAEIANRTFRTLAQWRLPGQVRPWSHSEGILFVGFGLHKHHYHLSRPGPALRLGGDPNSVWKPEWRMRSGPFRCEATERTFGVWNIGVFTLDVHPCTCSDLILTLLPCWLEPSASSF